MEPVVQIDDLVVRSNAAVAVRRTRDAVAVPTTQVRLKRILGDLTGTFVLRSTTSAVLVGVESGWAPDAATTRVQFVDGGKRRLVTTQDVLTAAGELYYADMAVEAGGKLYLPSTTAVCNITMSVSGSVFGAETLHVCQNSQTSASISTTGCKDPTAENFNSAALFSDNSTCYYGGVRGCTYTVASNFDSIAEVNDGSCVLPAGLTAGCAYSAASNFDGNDRLDDGSCTFPNFGFL